MVAGSLLETHIGLQETWPATAEVHNSWNWDSYGFSNALGFFLF